MTKREIVPDAEEFLEAVRHFYYGDNKPKFNRQFKAMLSSAERRGDKKGFKRGFSAGLKKAEEAVAVGEKVSCLMKASALEAGKGE